MTEDKLAKHYYKRYMQMEVDHTNWSANWQDIAEYVLPRKDDVYGVYISGEKKYQRLYDSTSVHANELLASALSGMMISQTSKWLGFETGDPELDEDIENKLWMQDAADKMLSVYDNSNFYTEMHELFLDLGSIGTSTIFQDEHPENVVYFRSEPIYGFYIEINNYKEVSALAYKNDMTYKQLVDEYTEENIPQDIKYRGHENQNAKFCVIVFVEENKDYDPKAPKIETNRPVRSVHILKDSMTTLRQSGYHEWPYAVPRWTVSSGEKYGRSPAMKAMPDIKMVNAMAKVNIRGAQKVVDPILQVPDSGFLLPLDTTPGGVNIYRQGMRDRIEPLQTGARPDIGDNVIEKIRQQIRQAFFIDQLQLREGPQMTATEVMQRTEEQLRLLGPILARITREVLRPTVDRTFGIMLRKGMFAEIPDGLKGKNLQIKFTSQIAKAQKASQADAFARTLQASEGIINYNPQSMDVFDPDWIIKNHAAIFGLDPKAFRSEEDVERGREQAAQEQLDAQAAEQENMAADTMQKMASAQTL